MTETSTMKELNWFKKKGLIQNLFYQIKLKCASGCDRIGHEFDLDDF